MTTLNVLKQQIEATLRKNGIDEASLDARLLISHIVPISEIDFAINGNQKITHNQVEAIEQLVIKRSNRIPMSQIFGEKEFWSLNFKVTKDTLTPRPDSETLIEVALKEIANKEAPLSILDLGTGSGCLLLSLLSELNTASGIGIDISREAIKIAQENAQNLLLGTRASFLESNWFDALPRDKKFDIIIANPPYIGLKEKPILAPEVRKYEPHEALFSGEYGLDDYRKIAKDIANYMTEVAYIILEIGYRQATEVSEIFRTTGFSKISTFRDLGGRDRCLLIRR